MLTNGNNQTKQVWQKIYNFLFIKDPSIFWAKKPNVFCVPKFTKDKQMLPKPQHITCLSSSPACEAVE